MIIWADEDGGDEGLHANFKLSKSGERLGLFTIDSVSLDEVEFPALNDNQSYGRCLNAWEYTRNPTFGIPNDCNITWVAESPKFEYVFCYPNPIDQRIQLVFNNAIPNLIIATDILGNIIYKSKTIDSKLFTIISDSWKPGLYNLHFIFSDIQTFQKIIKK
ncbi:MAG: T9SS type A sorting domain-containing protein [Saprospiraceae bacterium]|nr:T9SS type A sorting domain-containing protein [Saprospiraceae bacterium]